LGQQNNIISSIVSKGILHPGAILLFSLTIITSFFIPSNLLALTGNEFYSSDSLFVQPVDPYKSAYFQSEVDKYLGIPYIRGGATEKGFDCSGFVRQVYKEFFGIDLPHKSSSQSSLPFLQKIDRSELLTGDLVFFSTTGKNKRINHVGIYLSDGRFIHAAKGGVTISSLDNSYWKARFFVAKRVGNDDIWNRAVFDKGSEEGLSAVYQKYSSLFNLLSDPNERPYTFGVYPYYSVYSNDDEYSLGYEITWGASIANGSIMPRFTAFQKYSGFQSYSDNIPYYLEHDGIDLEAVSDRLSYQGMHFAAALGKNDDGFSLTPSFTYYDTGYDLDKRRLQRFTYGIDLEISPVNKSWLFAMGMKYSEYTFSDNLTSLNNSNEFNSPMNFSFTYLHRLNESAYLSFTSGVGQRYYPVYEENISDHWKNDRRSIFLFNFNY
jgi:hypothetical protein